MTHPQVEVGSTAGDVGEIPEGWAAVSLADIVQPVPNTKPEEQPDRLFGYVDISAIDNTRYEIVAPKQLKGKDAPSRARRPIQVGDVLFSNVRTYLRNVAIVPAGLPVHLCSTGFTVLRPGPAIDSQYLFRYVLTDDFIDRVTPQQTGTHYPATSDAAVLAESIPLAPHAEQKRIVAKVEELLAGVNAARERLARVPVILKRFRQAVLAAACSGRLTEDWRRLGPEMRGASAAAATGVDGLFEVPPTWQWTAFGRCAEDITVGHVGPTREHYVDRGIPFLRSQNVRPLRFALEGLKHVSHRFHAAHTKTQLRGGEILTVRSGANTGDTCVYPPGADQANCADLVITRPDPSLVASFGAIYIESPEGSGRVTLAKPGSLSPTST